MFRRSEIREENEAEAKKYGKIIVDMLAKGDYQGIFSVCDRIGNNWDLPSLIEWTEGYKELNELPVYDYDTPCSINITYKDGSKYTQENFYYNVNDPDDFSFSYEYDLLPTDLMLMLDFRYKDGMYYVVFLIFIRNDKRRKYV